MAIAAALEAVAATVGAVGKRDRNTAQGFNFRGIDAVVNAVSPALIEHGVIVVPILQSATYEPVEVGKSRTPMCSCRVVVTYRFIETGAGDSLDVTVPGEAMDSGDKATPKAMSVAFRTALLQALCLPTDEIDPDAQVYERAGAPDVQAFQASVARLDEITDLDALRELYVTATTLGRDSDAAAITARAEAVKADA